MAKFTQWQKIIRALKKAGVTPADINKKTGISISTISRLGSGTYKKLDYDSGVKLMAMYDGAKASGNHKK